MTAVIRVQTVARSWIATLSFGRIRTAIISLQTVIWRQLSKTELSHLLKVHAVVLKPCLSLRSWWKEDSYTVSGFVCGDNPWGFKDDKLVDSHFDSPLPELLEGTVLKNSDDEQGDYLVHLCSSYDLNYLRKFQATVRMWQAKAMLTRTQTAVISVQTAVRGRRAKAEITRLRNSKQLEVRK